jgi:hypothetical protein
MASAEDIALLRAMIGEPDNAEPWTDEVLSAMIDAAASLESAALSAWTAKAATYAGMVDTTESGSSRRLSQLQEQALKMVAFFRQASDTPEVEDLTGYAYTIAIERP